MTIVLRIATCVPELPERWESSAQLAYVEQQKYLLRAQGGHAVTNGSEQRDWKSINRVCRGLAVIERTRFKIGTCC